MSPSSFFLLGPATTEIYTLSLHDALPISLSINKVCKVSVQTIVLIPLLKVYNQIKAMVMDTVIQKGRSEEHTSELQSRPHLVCRLLLEKKKKAKYLARHL